MNFDHHWKETNSTEAKMRKALVQVAQESPHTWVKPSAALLEFKGSEKFKRRIIDWRTRTITFPKAAPFAVPSIIIGRIPRRIMWVTRWSDAPT